MTNLGTPATPVTVTPKVSSAYAPGISLFAKLLASENLTVTIAASAKTASFMPKERVLTLPSWTGFTEDAWLLFVAHEVGHALYTPADSFTHPGFVRLTQQHNPELVRNIMNVFEDIRIERLIREKYRGLTGVFGRGYASLLDKAFFGGDVPAIISKWESFGPMDRINVYAKVGALVRMPLSRDTEIRWYNAGLHTQTFDDVVTLVEQVLSEAALDTAPEHQGGAGAGTGTPDPNAPTQPSKPGQAASAGQDGDPQSQTPQAGDAGQSGQSDETGDTDGSGAGAGESGDAGNDPASGSAPGAGDPGADASASAQSGQGSGSNDRDLSVTTGQASERLMSQSVSYNPYREAGALVLPVDTRWLHRQDVPLVDGLTGWKVTRDEREVFYTEAVKARRAVEPILASMVATFRAHQSAWAQRRQQVSRTGLIDPVRLANYKLIDDIFLRRRSVPDAQNHGFVLTVDWSGSMGGSVSMVMWQVLHLLWFAEAVRVPVLVQVFSDAMGPTTSFDQFATDMRNVGKSGRGTSQGFVQLYDSTAPAAVKQQALAQLMMLVLRDGVDCGSYYTDSMGLSPADMLYMPKSARPHVQPVCTALSQLWADFPASDHYRLWADLTKYHTHLSMGGTPLVQSILSGVDIVREFRAKHRIEQCISVWLTDGDDTRGVCVDDPATREDGRVVYQKTGQGTTWVDPRSGRVFTQTHKEQLPTVLEIHRALTGATTVVVDLSAYADQSVRRVVPSGQMSSVMSRITGNDPTASSGQFANPDHGRRGRASKVRVVKQSRRKLVMPQVGGTFADTGLLVLDRKDQPAMGCDAYIVSHPQWWSGTVTTAQSSMASGIVKRLREIDDDEDEDDNDEDDYFTPDDDVDAYAQTATKLNATLLEQSGNQAMRRFADMLVPFMAAGRDDIT